MGEQSLEELYNEINDMKIHVAAVKKAMDEKEEKDRHDAEKDEKDRNDEKMAGRRARRDAAIRKAMEEDDEDRKDAAIRQAMKEYDDDGEKDEHKAETHDEKDREEKEHMAAIIAERKASVDEEIMRIASFTNPAGADALRKELAQKTYSASRETLDLLKHVHGDMFSGVTAQPPAQPTQATIPPYYAGQQQQVRQFNAGTPDSEFARYSEEDLIKMAREGTA